MAATIFFRLSRGADHEDRQVGGQGLEVGDGLHPRTVGEKDVQNEEVRLVFSDLFQAVGGRFGR